MYNTERNTEFFTLDWRDDSQGIIPYEKELDLILGADVAYYYYLKMPLLNTLKFFLNPVKTMVMITGQAHRQSQWDLYDALCKGCYNQNTDTKDEPWKGITRMLLFKLNQARWETETTVTGISSEATIPTTTMTTTTHGDAGFVNIATIIHQTDSNKKVQFTDQLDHEATSDDRYSFYID
jgi:Lysine methyltransferase